MNTKNLIFDFFRLRRVTPTYLKIVLMILLFLQYFLKYVNENDKHFLVLYFIFLKIPELPL